MSDITGTWKLKEDLVGPFSGQLYGKAGDWVEVLGNYGEMVIVQCVGGVRYPAKKSNLTQDDLPAPVEKTLKKMEEIKHSPVKKRKATKAPAAKVAPGQKQQTIF